MSRMAELDAEAEQGSDLCSIGGRIRWARKRRNMTQEDLANGFPVGSEKKRAVIGQYETNGITPSIDVINDLAVILDESPVFLAFGDRDAGRSHLSAENGESDASDRPENPIFEHTILPSNILHWFDAQGKNLCILQLAVDAPAFGCRTNDFMLLDSGRLDVKSDGALYAVRTTAGLALMRSEALIVGSELDQLQLTNGNGVSYMARLPSLETVGRLIAVLQKR